MTKFFSKFQLKKNQSYMKVEVREDNTAIIDTNITNFQFNEININRGITNIENRIKTLEEEFKNIDKKIEQYLSTRNVCIDPGVITVKGISSSSSSS